LIFFFFFQAEDGIRDKLVTGVQTCALPIWDGPLRGVRVAAAARHRHGGAAAEVLRVVSAPPPGLPPGGAAGGAGADARGLGEVEHRVPRPPGSDRTRRVPRPPRGGP